MNIQKLSYDPKIYTIANFLTKVECDHFVKISKGKLNRAFVSGQKEGYISQGRTGQNYWLNHNTDSITLGVAKKISQIVNIPLENAEAFQIIYYGVTQEYRQHYDAWDHDNSQKAYRNMKFGGQRLMTALVYLNDVEEGGGTRFTKLNKEVNAEKGKLLVFQNTQTGTNIKHELSEHAGMPVKKGEKWAFNLWFREATRSKLYKDINPNYFNQENNVHLLDSINTEIKKIDENYEKVFNLSLLNKSTIENTFYSNNFFTDAENFAYLLKCKFTQQNKRESCWINKNEVPDLMYRLEEITHIPSSYYESVNAIKYRRNEIHNDHYDAYVLESDVGKKSTEKYGQRLYTITIFLTEDINFNFVQKNHIYNTQKNSILIYKNTEFNSRNRDATMIHKIHNNRDQFGVLFNIYIREKNIDGNLLGLEKINNELFVLDKKTQDTSKQITKDEGPENYYDTYNNVLKRFENDEITATFRGHKSFQYLRKIEFSLLKSYVIELINLKKKNLIIQPQHLESEYSFDEYHPVIVDNVLHPEALKLFQHFFRNAINNNIFELGDRQAKRYRAHNEPFSRFLHYEVLPLMERITGKKLRPTYTYLSAYVKGADLPEHTDRGDCEFTVSFLIEKPENTKWPIYVHKKKQPTKHIGRTNQNPPKEECIEVDCQSGGLMMFCGTDHIHFREPLEHNFYNIVLLHYCSIN